MTAPAPTRPESLPDAVDPLYTAHDIYILSQLVPGLDWRTYQDIQNDQAMYDSFQRWPFLFAASTRQLLDEQAALSSPDAPPGPGR